VRTVPVAAPVTTTAVPVQGRPVVAPVAHSSAMSSARPAYRADGTKRGWFDFDQRR
jgi:hypothetical protein